MDERKVDISIIIPLYKGEKYIKRLVQMIGESYLYKDLYKECNIEVVFINDFPEQHIDVQGDLFPVRVIVNSRNQGIHQSRVNGIEHANGKYVILFDQDDLFKKNYLYSQWKKMKKSSADFCVCKGWSSRFRTVGSDKNYEMQINSLENYFRIGNPIMSPGQVLIKKECIPAEWKMNVQKKNGTDDCLLWVIALQKNKNFILNEDYLYYHTPERTIDSVSSKAMTESMEEMKRILNANGLLSEEQEEQLKQQIRERKLMIEGIVPNSIEEVSLEMLKKVISIKKFRKMFLAMTEWMCLKNQGKDIEKFLSEKGYYNVAIQGMGYIGELLYEELKNSSIDIRYAIDRSALDFEGELAIFRMEEELPKVDLIISTVLENSDKLIAQLKEKCNCNVLRIDEILNELK